MKIDHPQGGVQPPRRKVHTKRIELMRTERTMEERWRALDRTNGQDDFGHAEGGKGAIPTDYGNCKFRSRSEARWAVFFDCLGIEWEYEKQGFDLGEPYGMYLPDFWLPQVGMWAEVKGVGFNEFEIEKTCVLSKHTGNAVLFLDGQPKPTTYWAFCHQSIEAIGDGFPGFYDVVLGGGELYHIRESRFFTSWGSTNFPDREDLPDTQDYHHAAAKVAKYARFEPGEDPLKMVPKFLTDAIKAAERDAQRNRLREIGL